MLFYFIIENRSQLLKFRIEWKKKNIEHEYFYSGKIRNSREILKNFAIHNFMSICNNDVLHNNVPSKRPCKKGSTFTYTQIVMINQCYLKNKPQNKFLSANVSQYLSLPNCRCNDSKKWFTRPKTLFFAGNQRSSARHAGGTRDEYPDSRALLERPWTRWYSKTL